MKRSFVFWLEAYFYKPSTLQKILSLFLFPFSLLYCGVMYLRFKSSREENLGVHIISIGNLHVGGSGKTPLVSALANEFEHVAIVLRGYGRASKGLYIVSDAQSILCDVATSGDEAMIYAQKNPQAIIIVSEDRKKGILQAKKMGAKIIFLDDGYSKHSIKKLDFLIDIEHTNRFCLPSGPFRERAWASKSVDRLIEGQDFTRLVSLKDKCDKMSLVTAIARPQRLDTYLPKVETKTYFEDHHMFSKSELEAILQRDKSDSLLVTYKDFVKIESFGLPLSLLDLDVQVDAKVLENIRKYTRT